MYESYNNGCKNEINFSLNMCHFFLTRLQNILQAKIWKGIKHTAQKTEIVYYLMSNSSVHIFPFTGFLENDSNHFNENDDIAIQFSSCNRFHAIPTYWTGGRHCKKQKNAYTNWQELKWNKKYYCRYFMVCKMQQIIMLYKLRENR